jgi:hypothetical protein
MNPILSSVLTAAVLPLTLWLVNLEYRVRVTEVASIDMHETAKLMATIQTDLAVLRSDVGHIKEGQDDLRTLLREQE